MSKISKNVVLMALIIMGSKLLGIVREIVLANNLGTSLAMDAYAVCIGFPTIVNALFFGGVSQSYMSVRARSDEEHKVDFSNVFCVLTIAGIIIALISMLCSNTIATIMAPGFDDEGRAILSALIKIIAWLIPATIMFEMISTYLQVREDFGVAYFCNYILTNIVAILFIVATPFPDTRIYVLGIVIAMILSYCCVIIYAKKRFRYRHRLVIRPFEKNMRTLYRLSMPLGLSIFAGELNQYVDRMFASNMGVGVTSALSYASRMQQLLLAFTTSILIAACFPRITALFSEKKEDGAWYYVNKIVMLSTLIAIPFMIFVIFYSRELISFVFERGAFDSNSTDITSKCLACYSIGIPFYSLRDVYSKVLVAKMEQKKVLINTIVCVLMNIILDFLMSRWIGYLGLPIATSIIGIVSFVLMYSVAKDEAVPQKNITSEVIKITLSSFISVALSYVCIREIIDQKMTLIIAVLISAIIYIVLCELLKESEWIWLRRKAIGMAKKKIQDNMRG